MEFYNCLNCLRSLIGCTFDEAFLIALCGFAFLVHFLFEFVSWLAARLFSHRKKDRSPRP